MKNWIRQILPLGLAIAFAFSDPGFATESVGDRALEVNHVIIAWLNNPGDEQARSRLIAATKGFGNLPGVVALQVGSVLASDRAVVDSSFDVAAVITFKNEKALKDYLEHPVHKKALDRVMKPLVKRVLVYDFFSD